MAMAPGRLGRKGAEPGTPRAGCRREKCCRSAPQAKMSYSRLTAPVAQGTEQRTSNPSVGGSNPPRRASNYNGLGNLVINYCALGQRYGQHFAEYDYPTTQHIASWLGADHPLGAPYSERPSHEGNGLRWYPDRPYQLPRSAYWF